jgi:HAD superfamily hydrolase (TIGR01509 family)
VRDGGPTAVIFDMDGVLVDSEPLHEQAIGAVLAAEGHRLTADEYAGLVGTTVDYLWDFLFKRFPLAGDWMTYHARYESAIVERLTAGDLEPEPGVRDLIRRFTREGRRLAVASSSPDVVVRATLAGLGLHDTFALHVAGDQVARGKPDPEIYLAAASLLGVPPARCLAIEDSLHGIEAARRAKMAVVAVRTRYTTGRALDATRVVDSLEELLAPDALADLLPRSDA